jgi:hypothetical protein
MRKSMDQKRWIFLKLTFLTLILCLAQGSLVVLPAHSETLSEKEILWLTDQEIGKSFEKNLIMRNNGMDDLLTVIALNKDNEGPDKTKEILQKNEPAVTLNQIESVFPEKKVECPDTEWGTDWTVQEDGTIKWPDSKKFKRIQVKSLSNTKEHLGYLFKKPKGK